MKTKIWANIVQEHNKSMDCCLGFYYNFKKGSEICINRKNCALYQKYKKNDEKKWYHEFRFYKFIKISDFRKCKKYKQ